MSSDSFVFLQDDTSLKSLDEFFFNEASDKSMDEYYDEYLDVFPTDSSYVVITSSCDAIIFLYVIMNS